MSVEEDKYGPLREAATKLWACQIGQLPKREGDRGFHVWVQGVIVQIENDGNQLTLDDGTGLVVVQGITPLISGASWIELGKYVMVSGHVSQCAAGDWPSLVTTKIADFSTDRNCEVMWWLEVMDIQLRLGGDAVAE